MKVVKLTKNTNKDGYCSYRVVLPKDIVEKINTEYVQIYEHQGKIIIEGIYLNEKE